MTETYDRLENQPPRIRLVDLLLGLAVALGALVANLATMTASVPAGDSARLIVQHLELVPFGTTLNPIWGLFARLIDRIPIANLALKLNLFSAVCGAAAVFLFYNIVVNAVRRFAEGDEDTRPFAVLASRCAALAGSSFLAFSIPFWAASNRASTDSFDIMLMLIATRIFLAYVWSHSERMFLLFAFVCGIVAVESATFIAFIPVFALSFLFLAWIRGALRVSFLAKAILCLLLGLSFYFLEAWRFYRSPSYRFAGVVGYFDIIWKTLGQQFSMLKSGVALQNWLIIHLMAVAPTIASAFTVKQALRGERQAGYYLLYSVFAAISLVLLLNPQFSPIDPTLAIYSLVTPYVLAAWVFAQTIAYTYIILSSLANESSSGLVKAISRPIGSLLAGVAVVLALASSALNWNHTDTRSSAYINAYVREVLDSMNGRSWLITDGFLDSHLMISAHERDIALTVINRRRTKDDSYMKYIASLFDSPRFQSLSQIGFLPLLQEWSASTPDLAMRLALTTDPDLWTIMQMTPVPNKTVSLGTKDLRSVDSASLLTDHMAFWKRTVPLLERKAAKDDRSALAPKYLLSRLSLMANNLGVFLQDAGLNDDSCRAYMESLSMHPDGTNVSALLNLVALADGGYVKSDTNVEHIRSRFEDFVASDRSRYLTARLSHSYGYVWDPRSFLERGWMWIRSGSRQVTVPLLKEMIRRKGSNVTKARKSLAALYRVQNDRDKNQELFRAILDDHPNDHQALLSLARILADKGNLDAAEDLLTKTKSAGVPEKVVQLERAILYWVSGRFKEARVMLEDLLKDDPDFVPALAVLGDVLLSLDDQDALDSCAQELEKSVGVDPRATATLGRIAAAQGQLVKARGLYNQSLRTSHSPLPLLGFLLDLDVRERRQKEARAHVNAMLAIAPDNAKANYILATLQIADGNYELAEDSLRRSLASQRTAEALNSLAWAMLKRGVYADALPYVKESLKMEDGSAHAWDTLGMIYMHMGRIDEAQSALETAVFTLGGVRVEILSHLAEVYEKAGKPDRALEVVRACLAHEKRLSPDLAKTLRIIQHRITKAKRSE